MAMEIRCSCMDKDAKWELQGALNTVELLAESNLRKLEGEIAAQAPGPPTTGPTHEEMARWKLKHDLEAIRELKVLIDKVPLCELKPRR